MFFCTVQLLLKISYVNGGGEKKKRDSSGWMLLLQLEVVKADKKRERG